jgi:hypothetical protein
MKVKIGPYTNWFGPYQLAELLCFWAKEEKNEFGIPRKPDWVHNFGEWLAHGDIEPEAERLGIEEHLAKFAELIVRECADIADFCDQEESVEAVSSVLKRHFGVEE